jgi:5-oxoprolinase (ATP-hydrolysing) subunit A
MVMLSVDLNCDLGESYGLYKIGNDEEVLRHITSANIACGFHAGDQNVMMETVKMAKSHGVKIGAHPGFPDLHGFGRREMHLTPQEIYNLTVYQIGAIEAVARVCGTKVFHVKPHGALYNIAAREKCVAEAIVQAVFDVNSELVLFGLAGSLLVKAGEEKGLKVAQEVFADRNYQPDGTLTPRSQADAIIHDTEYAIERVIHMVKQGKVRAVDGSEIRMKADTICVHGDEPQTLEFVVDLKQALLDEGISIVKSWDIK